MKHILSVRASVFVLAFVAFFFAQGNAEEPARIPVLVIGGSSGSHRTKQMVDLAVEALKTQRIDLDYTEDLSRINAKELAKVKALFIFRDFGDLTNEQDDALVSAVENGLGLTVIHCGSHCFRNSTRYTKLVGGRFLRHGYASFGVRVIDSNHATMTGLGNFNSTDETYVHNELAEDNRVLMVRAEGDRYEPYTWVRKQGKGRIFYTALGHDQRTWSQPEFHKLLTNGIRWAAQQTAPDIGEDTERKINPRRPWDVEPTKAFTPAESMKRMTTPAGLHVELFAAEPDIVKPITMTFDARGRLWVVESVDYPNTLYPQPDRQGHDRIKICEDTDGDGKADKFTIFADNLNIPTALLCYKKGVIVACSPHILFLEDTDGDGVCDQRQILFTGFGRGDTHAVHSNFRYGLDNWIWATVGYSGGNVMCNGVQHRFNQGVFRFRPDGSAFEVLAPTSNNTWGLAFNEFGDPFVSTANDDHCLHLAIPNRYFEQVRGWSSKGIASIADYKRMHPITSHVRQVDFFGRFTAAAGSTVYTARDFPQEYWNRTAFICEPTGHLVHTALLAPTGASFAAHDGWNLLASNDPWSAFIQTEVGPDGAVWVIDWYNFIVRHNPTPPGFQTGPGNAYVTPLRDKLHGRIYRVVADSKRSVKKQNLEERNSAELIAALRNSNAWIRTTAQRRLVESKDPKATKKLLSAVTNSLSHRDHKPESASLVQMMATLDGLGAFQKSDGDEVLLLALAEKSPEVRRAALEIVARHPKSTNTKIPDLARSLLSDPARNVRLAAMKYVIDCSEQTPEQRRRIARALAEVGTADDSMLELAATAASAKYAKEFLESAQELKLEAQWAAILAKRTRIVAEHFARGNPDQPIADVLKNLTKGSPLVSVAVLEGLAAGWQTEKVPVDREACRQLLSQTFPQLPPQSLPAVLDLAQKWKIQNSFADAMGRMRGELLKKLDATDASMEARTDAAKQLVRFSDDRDTIRKLAAKLSPQLDPADAEGWIAAMATSRSNETGIELVATWPQLSLTLRKRMIAELLRRPAWTKSLLDAMEQGSVSAGDFAVDQAQQLANHPDSSMAQRAKTLLAKVGSLSDPDRQRIVKQFLDLTTKTGDATRGIAVFKEQCAKCHRHGKLGESIGPDLTGLAVRPKAEILTDILDPNRSVEGNFRQYTISTVDGLLYSGLLTMENRNAIEILDSQAKRTTILRNNIEQMKVSNRSVMPEGFEKLKPEQLTDLLAFLAQRGKYVPLPMQKAATILTTHGMFYDTTNTIERIVFDTWGAKESAGVPYQLIDPRGDAMPNAILLYSNMGAVTSKMPKQVSIDCHMPARAIHILGGVSGWGYPYGPKGSTSMIVRLHYADGKTEDHELKNGVHFADYIRRVDVPDSQFAFSVRGKQLRTIVVKPARNSVIDKIDLVKGADRTAPLVMAVTVETE